jgi:predicted dehydrogenase
MKVLIVGLGSIAKKHIEALKGLNVELEIVALRSSKNALSTIDIQNVYSWDEVPLDISFVLISNPTFEHKETIQKALKFQVPIFLEKPPLMSLQGAEVLVEQIKKQNSRIYTAFNLRFHPVVDWLKHNLVLKNVLEVQVYCGSYLPDWRKDQDYRKNYSAIAAQGGGVHLDLIHELDYVRWIFGLPEKTNTFQRKVSDLEMDSIDSAHYWLMYSRFNVSILLNYYRRDPKRYIEIVTKEDTIYADLLNGRITNSKGKLLFEAKNLSIIHTYSEQMKYFIANMNTNEKFMNDFNESIETLKIGLYDIK